MSSSMDSQQARGTRSTDGTRERMTLWPSQWLGLLTGAIFVVVGVAGFFVTGFDDFAYHHTGERLIIFEVNPLHNIVHLALGVLAFALCWSRKGTLTYGAIVAGGYLAAFIYGLFAVDATWDFLSLNPEDNWLHLGLAVLGAAIAGLAAAELRSQRDPARQADRVSSTRGRRPASA
jgi:hypothetical protein